MTVNGNPLLEIQRQILATMHRMFTTSMSCFKAIDYQLEQYMRLVFTRSRQSGERNARLMEEWVRNFREGQEAYQRFFEDSLKRAQEILEQPEEQ
jgi:hypothetical protein